MPETEQKTKNPHESTWDHHGGYQWTYFAEEIKQRISFFLSERLHGKNIDLGGGWYLSYHNSTVVDLSSVCLDYNPAQEKLHFDLDELAKGKKLPYPDNSFDSATLISVWQYLKHPKVVVTELKRLLVPGGEIYIINGQSGGLEECMHRSGRYEKIQKFFQNLGYDTLIEDIPSSEGEIGEFKSVCAALPQINIFGEIVSEIKNKVGRFQKNQEICNDPSRFLQVYQNYELSNVLKHLFRLSTFPITQYSQDYLGKVEAFSQKFHQKTGFIPLIFAEHTTLPELLMLMPEYKHYFGTMFIMGKNKEADNYHTPTDLLQKYNLSFVHHCNYFDQQTITQLLRECRHFKPDRGDIFSVGNSNEQRKYIAFIAALALNSFTTHLQKRMYELLKPRIANLDKQIVKQKAYAYHLATNEDKQKRRIGELIRVKQQINDQQILTVGWENIDIPNLFPYLSEFIN